MDAEIDPNPIEVDPFSANAVGGQRRQDRDEIIEQHQRRRSHSNLMVQ